jgi:hypothetical protein
VTVLRVRCDDRVCVGDPVSESTCWPRLNLAIPHSVKFCLQEYGLEVKQKKKASKNQVRLRREAVENDDMVHKSCATGLCCSCLELG